MKTLIKSFLPSLILLLLCIPVDAQRKQVKEFETQASKGFYAGKTKPVSEFAHIANTADIKRQKRKTDKKPLNFIGRGKTDPANISPYALPKDGDPVRQETILKNAGREAAILVNIEGLTSGSPNDPCGDIGQDFYIQMVNATRWQVFDKTGSPASAPMTMNAIWSQVGFSSAGDPIILYDQEYDRWILTEFPPGNQLLVAVSETSNPMGSYYVYNFPTPNFPDYPKYALWNNTLYATTNEQGFGTSTAYFIDRLALINGEADPAIQRLTFPGVGSISWYTPTPVDWTGANPPSADTPPMILNMMDDAWGESEADQIDIYHFNIDFADSDNTNVEVVEVPTAPFDGTDTDFCSALGPGFACIPQPNGQGIDGIPQVVMHQSHYRNFGSHESMVLNFTVGASDTETIAGIRWMELRKTSTSDWTVYQEGTFAPDDGENRFMGGIAMDGKGNIGLAYTVSSENTFPSLRFTGRYAGDPLGVMTLDEVEFATGVSSNSGPRFGDYAQMTVDPKDDVSFWFTAEYMGSNQGSTTQILSFQFQRDTIDIGPVAILEPLSGGSLTDSETVRVEVRNFGLDTQFVFDVGYSFQGTEIEEDQVNFVLAPDSSYFHTFDTPVDMSVIANYDFEVYTTLENDAFTGNDTLQTRISKLPRFDAGISNIRINGPVCEETAQVEMVLSNFGTEPLESVDLIYNLNGVIINDTWTGSLEQGQSEVINYSTTDQIGGTNTFTATTSMPNMMEDQNMSNDGFAAEFQAIVDASPIFLKILTDMFPGETTWVLRDENGDEVASGGPYADPDTEYVIELCLDPEACYTFEIFDSYADGICCFFGEGSYEIVDGMDRPLLIGDGDFGASASNMFCAKFMCMLSADIETAPESSVGLSDGTILITAENAASEVSYSIDNGETFQSDPFFNNLPADIYEVVVQTEFGCTYTETVEITACNLEILIAVVDESVIDLGDGSISISVSNGNEPLMFSIDGGQTFQESGDFLNLTNGDYIVVIEDSLGCRYEETVTVDYVTSTENESQYGYFVEVAPNPTDGVFKVRYHNPASTNLFTRIYIYNSTGERIQSSNLGKWNGTYEGQFSLVAYPSGTYYLKFEDKEMDKLVRVIKL